MKHILFTALVLCAVIAAAPSWAEQFRCKVFDGYQAGGPGNNDRRMEACQRACKRISGDLDYYLSNGWSVDSQRPIEIRQRPFKTNLVDVPDEGFCICRGAEYILKR